MTRSEPDPIEPLPPAGRSLWRMFQLGWQHERPLLALSLAMTLLTMLPDALLAWWLRLLADGLLDGDRRSVLTAAGLVRPDGSKDTAKAKARMEAVCRAAEA